MQFVAQISKGKVLLGSAKVMFCIDCNGKVVHCGAAAKLSQAKHSNGNAEDGKVKPSIATA